MGQQIYTVAVLGGGALSFYYIERQLDLCHGDLCEEKGF
jgi:hypothetical protein